MMVHVAETYRVNKTITLIKPLIFLLILIDITEIKLLGWVDGHSTSNF
jgi:hypothetical protein